MRLILRSRQNLNRYSGPLGLERVKIRVDGIERSLHSTGIGIGRLKEALVRADGARPGHFVVVMCRDHLPTSTVVSAVISAITVAIAVTAAVSVGAGAGAGAGTATATATVTVTVTATTAIIGIIVPPAVPGTAAPGTSAATGVSISRQPGQSRQPRPSSAAGLTNWSDSVQGVQARLGWDRVRGGSGTVLLSCLRARARKRVQVQVRVRV